MGVRFTDMGGIVLLLGIAPSLSLAAPCVGAACARNSKDWRAPAPSAGNHARRGASEVVARDFDSPRLGAVIPSGLRFYVYDDAALDQSWLAQCEGFRELKESAEGEGMQESNLYRVLKSHPYRTRNANEAALFYIPIWEYSSFRLGNCSGTTHVSRMQLAANVLRASPHFRRSFGRDHFWASSMAVEVTNVRDRSYGPPAGYVDKHRKIAGMHLKTASLAQRLGPLTLVLMETSVGRMKAFGRVSLDDNRHHAVVGRCTFDMGHQPNQVALRAFPRAGTPRPTFVYFAGGLDVCCTGREIRCRVGQLLLAENSDVVIDIGLRGDVIRQLQRDSNASRAPPCTLQAINGLASKRNVPPAALVRQLLASGGQDEPNSDKYSHMGRMMASSVFCLCPAGDLCTTSRFVTAISAGCIPVVLCDGFEGPFGKKEGSHLTPVPYESFAIKYPARAFIQNPLGLLQRLRAMTRSEVMARQAALRAHRRSILMQLPGAVNAGTRFLEEVADCVELNAAQPVGARAKSLYLPRVVLRGQG